MPFRSDHGGCGAPRHEWPVWCARDACSGLLEVSFDAVAAFKKLDLDGNGSIDLDEMKAAVEKAGLTEAFPADKCEALFKAIDTNGDGEIDEEEFKAGCAASDEAQLGLLQKIVDAC